MALTFLFILLTVFGSGRSDDGLGTNISVTTPGGSSLQESEWSVGNPANNCTLSTEDQVTERGKIVKRCIVIKQLCCLRPNGVGDRKDCVCPPDSIKRKSAGSTTKTIPKTTNFSLTLDNLTAFGNSLTKSRNNIKSKLNSFRQNTSEPVIFDKEIETGPKWNNYNQSETSTDILDDADTTPPGSLAVVDNVSISNFADDSLNIYDENQANENEIPKMKREDSDEKFDFFTTELPTSLYPRAKKVINVNYGDVDFNKDINKTGWEEISRNNFSDVNEDRDKHGKVYVLVAGNLDVKVDINNAFFDGSKSLEDDYNAKILKQGDDKHTTGAQTFHEAYNSYNRKDQNKSLETRAQDGNDEDISKLWDEVINRNLESSSKMNEYQTTSDDNNYNRNNDNLETGSNFNSPRIPPTEPKATNGYLWSENKRDRESSVNLPSTKQVKQSYASRDGDYQVSKEDVSGSKEVNYWQTKTESTFSCNPQPENYEIGYSDNESIDKKPTYPDNRDRKEEHDFVDGQFVKIKKEYDEDLVKITDNVNLESSKKVSEKDQEEDYTTETGDDPAEDDESNFQSGIRSNEEAPRQSNYEYRSRSTSDLTNGRNDRLMSQVAPQFLPNAQPYVPLITFQAYDKFQRGSNVNNYPIMRIYYPNKHRWNSIPMFNNNMYVPPRQRCPQNYRYY